jgi:hypothetical protein
MKKADVSSIIGMKSGKVMAIADAGKNKYGHSLVLYKCECGTEKIGTYSNFKAGAYVSCGCVKPKGLFRHGMTRTRTHNIWMLMRRRCEDPSNPEYKRYGAKGVTVCDRWQTFDNFLADMGVCPPSMSIDRIDGSGNYELSNCRWATPKQQTENRSIQVFYNVNGERLTLPDVAKKYNVNYRTLRNRLFRTGMTLDEALNHEFGATTEKGRNRITEAVRASNRRRGNREAQPSKGIR